MADDDEARVSMDSTSERLYEELRELMARADAVPPEVVGAAKGAFSWRTIDADLAQLAFDSMVDRETVLVRSDEADATRLLTFESAEVTVELELEDAGAMRRLTGRLVPAEAATVEIRHAGGRLEVVADERGRFRAEIDPGPMSLRWRTGGDQATVVETDWLTV